jgi:hypothetical protein
MAHRLTKQAITTYVPAVQAVIAQPAYWQAVVARQLVTKYAGAKQTGVLIPVYGRGYDTNGQLRDNMVIGYTQQTTAGQPYTAYENVTTYVYHPAVEGVEGRDATVSADQQAGWNAGAQSAEIGSGDFYARFTIPATDIGVIVGLADPASASGVYGAIEHGLRYSTGNAVPAVLERGVDQGEVATPQADTYVCEVRRVDGDVTYVVNGNVTRSASRSSGTKVLAAVLYAATDYVDDPTLDPVAALSSEGSWGWADAPDVVSLRARIAWGWNGSASLGDARGGGAIELTMQASDYDRASASMIMAEPTLGATFGFAVVESAGATLTFSLDMLATGNEVSIGSASDTLELTMHSADYDYGDVAMFMAEPTLFALSTEDPPNQADTTDQLLLAVNYSFDPVIFAILPESLRVGVTFDVLISMDAMLADTLALYSDLDASAVLEAMLNSGLRFSDNASAVADTLLQYVTHLRTGAVTRYEAFDFAGFAQIGQQAYGYRSDGVYRLAGRSDDGELIQALIDFAAEDFGISQTKRIDTIYLGLATDGQVFVRLTEGNDRSMTYRTRARRDSYRTDPAQGITSRYWRMRLEIVDATYADLDLVEWLAVSTGRRLLT